MLGGGALALTLVLSGCGGGDEAQAAEAISASMMEDSDDEFTVDQEQADCVGEGMVDEIGVDKLQEYGILTDDLTSEGAEGLGDTPMEEGDADSAADVIVSCVDAEEMMAEQMAADATMTDEQKECVSEALDEDALKQMFSLIFQGKEDQATQDLMGPLMECVVG